MPRSLSDYPRLPLSVPHPLICRPATRRGFVSLFTSLVALFVTFGLARASGAAPCTLPQVRVPAMQEALGLLAAPPPLRSPSAWHRLGSLLPRKVAWTSRDGHNDGAGWYAGLEGGVSERALWGSTSGWSLRLIWDLQPLWRPTPAISPSRWRDPLHRAEQLERLAARLGTRLRELARLRGLTRQADSGDAVCARLQAEARASLLAIDAALLPIGGRAGHRLRPSGQPSPPAAGPGSPGPGRPPSPTPGRAGSDRSDGL